MLRMPSTLVFDSWALLSWLKDEAAAAEVGQMLEDAAHGRCAILMSWVNIGEVFYMLSRKLGVRQADAFRQALPQLPIRCVPVTPADAWAAAELKAGHRASYADCFAAALALRHDCALVTGDPEMRQLPGIRLHWLSP